MNAYNHNTPGKCLQLLTVAVALALFTTNAFACGKERWPVKVGTDRDASRVSMAVHDTNIAALVRIAPPRNPDIRRDSRYSPTETTVYRVSGLLTLIKRERDGDYHLVIEDSHGRTMIVEAPSERCAIGSRFEKQIDQVRKLLASRYQVTRKLHPDVPVTVTGIGFFDRKHGQDGVAPNGIELHPLLAFQFN